MATRDQYDRDTGADLSVAEMAKQMNAPTTRNVEHENVSKPDGKQKEFEKLEEAVNKVAERIDANAGKELEQSKSWVGNIFSFFQGFNKPKTPSESESRATGYFESMARATEGLWQASQKQNAIWVGISDISSNAQRDLSRAFGMSDCCKALATATRNTRTAGKKSDVVDASRAGMPSASGGADSAVEKIADAVSGRRQSGGAGRRGSGGSGGAGGGDGGLGGMGDSARAAVGSFTVAGLGAALKTGLNRLEVAHKKFIEAMDLSINERVFKGLITDSLTFSQNIRQIVHQQQGFGDANREMEQSYIDITQSVSSSGVRRNEYQKIYLQNLERGLTYVQEEDKLKVKDLALDKKEIALQKIRTNRMQNVQTSALNTAKTLHMSTSSINDLFMDWHMSLGMSENSLAEMGRHMRSVSISTGVTGEQMAAAMKNADGVAKNLKKSGLASVDAMKKVNSFMVAAQKHGYEGAAELMNALGTQEGFLESKQKVFLMKSAAALGGERGNQAMGDLQMGRTLQTPDGMKNLMEGQEKLVRNMFSSYEGNLQKFGFSSKDLDVANVDKVVQTLMQSKDRGDQAAANALIMRFKGLGMEVGEVAQSYRAMKEMPKSPTEAVDKLKTQLDNMVKAGQGNSDEYKRVNKQLLVAQTDMGMDAFGRMSTFSKQLEASGGVIGEDLKKQMVQNMQGAFGSETGALDFINNLSKNTNEMIVNMDQRAKDAGMNMNAILAKEGFKDQKTLKEALQRGDQGAVDAMQKISQEIAVNEGANQDPLSKVQRYLDQINNKIGEFLDKNVGFGPDILKYLMYFGGYLVGAVGVLGGIVLSLMNLAMMWRTMSTLCNIGSALGGGGRPGMPGSGGVPGGGVPGGGRPGGGVPGGGRPGMPGSPVSPSPVGGPVAPSPVGGPVVPPNHGGTGWAGTRGTGVVDSPAALRNAGASRADRRANAERYLAARQAGGQSGRGFGDRAGTGSRRIMPQGKGILGLFGKVANFAMRNPELTGAAVGAGVGYATSDSETTMGALGDAALGGAVGGAAGYGGRMLMGGGLKAGGLPSIADTAMMGTDMMSGMPGFGANCMPVCIVGGLDGLSGMMGGMMGGGGLANTALGTLNTVDAVSDVAGMVGKGGKVAGVADDVARAAAGSVDDVARVAAGGADDVARAAAGSVDDVARVAAGGADDVAKAGGWFSRLVGKVPGGTAVMEKASGLASTVSTKASGLASTVSSKASGLATGAKSMLGTFGDDIAVKAASMMPAVTKAGGAVGGVAKGAGALLGKLAGPLSLAVGGLTGAMEAQSAGRTTTEGAVYGALTGGAHKGSFASETLGLEKGGAADEMLGVAGAAGMGAMTGAAIGSVVPVVGTAVGAGVGAVIGAGAELTKVFTAEESGLRDAIGGFAENVGTTIAGIPGTIGGAFNSMGSYLGEGAYSIYESISGFASNIGTTFSSGIDSVTSGITNFATGVANTATSGFAGTAKENWDRMLGTGPSVVGAAGQLAGGAGDVLQGNISQGATKAALAIVEALGAGGQGLMGAAKAGISAINPLNWFKEGTREIQKPGIGVLHEGEMIIPKDVLQQIKATGDGAFKGNVFDGLDLDLGEITKSFKAMKNLGGSDQGAGSSIIGAVGAGITSSLGGLALSLTGPMGGIISSLTGIMASKSAPAPQASVALEGVFEKGQAKEAIDSDLAKSIKFPPLVSDVMGPPSTNDLKKWPMMKDLDSLKSLDETSFESVDEQVKQTSLLQEISNKLVEVGPSLLGAFEKDEGTNAIDSASDVETKQMSYWGTAIGAALAGPMGALAGFAADSVMSGLSLEDALSQTVGSVGAGAKNIASTLGLGLFDSEKPDEAQEAGEKDMLGRLGQSLMGAFGANAGGVMGSNVGGIAGTVMGSSFGGIAGGIVGAGAGSMIGNSLGQAIGGLAQNNKGVASMMSLGLFDPEQSSEAQDSGATNIIEKMTPSLLGGLPIAGSLLSAGGGPGGIAAGAASGMIGNSLGQAIGGLAQNNKGVASMMSLGLFDPNKPKETQEESVKNDTQKVLSRASNPEEAAGLLAAMKFKSTDRYEHDAQGMFKNAMKQSNKQMAGAYSTTSMSSGQEVDKNLGASVGGIGGLFKKHLTEQNKDALQGMQQIKTQPNVTGMGLFDAGMKDDAQDETMKNLLASSMGVTGLMSGSILSEPGAAEKLFAARNDLGKSNKGDAKLESLGLFNSDNAKDAQDDSASLMSQLIGSGANLNEVVKSIIDVGGIQRTEGVLEKNAVVETSKALLYGQEASDAAAGVDTNRSSLYGEDKSNAGVGTNTMDYRDQIDGINAIYKTDGTPIDGANTRYKTNGMPIGDVKTNMLDYREEMMKGDVGTLGTSRFGVESAVERKKYSDMNSNNSAVLPSMDAIAEYLNNVQVAKLDQMIHHLEAISRNTERGGGAAGSDIIGPDIAAFGPAASGSGIKSMARDMNRGSWPITHGDYAPGSVTTEGNGGIA